MLLQFSFRHLLIHFFEFLEHRVFVLKSLSCSSAKLLFSGNGQSAVLVIHICCLGYSCLCFFDGM